MGEKTETSVLRLYWSSLPGKGNLMKALSFVGVIAMCAATVAAIYLMMWAAFYYGMAM